MQKFGARGVAALVTAIGALGLTIMSACAEKKGSLLMAIDTNMTAPKDVNAVSVTISTNGAIKHSFIGRVTPQGEVLLPATLAIVEPEDKSASIRIRVMAFQNQKPRVLRDVRTTIPADGRTALLRIPLNFVNDGSAIGPPLPNGVLPDPIPGTGSTTGGSAGGTSSSGELPSSGGAADFDFFGAFQPPCPDIDKETIIDGVCRDNFVDPATLPDFEEAALGSSTDVGSCFDLAKCFAGGTLVGSGENVSPGPVGDDDGGTRSDASVAPGDSGTPPADPDGGGKFKDFAPRAVTLDRTTCSLQLNGANPARLNIALVTPDTGSCVRPGECYVPVDRGGAGGWKDENGRVQLPSYVCALINGKNLRLATSAETCAAKTESNPYCRGFSSGPPSVPPAAPGGNPFNRCGSQSTCTAEEIKPFNDCLYAQCNTRYSQCFGPGWNTGSFSGPCGPVLQCITACPCNDTTCTQKCGNPSDACKTCLDTTAGCGEECTQPACAMVPPDGGSSGSSGSSGSGGTHTCAELAACCAAIVDTSIRDACVSAHAGSDGNDAMCSNYYSAFGQYCQ